MTKETMTDTVMTDEEVQRLAKSGFSKGPWYARQSQLPKGFGETLDVISRKYEKRGVVFWSGFDENDVPKKENVANARLIAAAPCLLAKAIDQAATIKSQQAEIEHLQIENEGLRKGEGPILAFMVFAEIREILGVGVKPMLSELPDAVLSALVVRDAEITRLRSLIENHKEYAFGLANEESATDKFRFEWLSKIVCACVTDLTAEPNPEPKGQSDAS